MNARSARAWLVEKLGSEAAVPKHFVAVSTATEEVQQVRHRHQQHVRLLGLGRRALLALERHRPAHRADDRRRSTSRQLLAGGHAMDEHFRTAPLEKNVPLILGMLGVWYMNFFGGADARHPALRPVPVALRRLLPAGRHGEQRQARRPRRGASSTDYDTGPIVWGEPGTNGQHAFYQLIHQGTRLVPCDFLAPHRDAQPARQAPRRAARELLRADRGADAGQDARGGARRAAGAEPARRAHRRARAAQDVPRQPARRRRSSSPGSRRARSAC